MLDCYARPVIIHELIIIIIIKYEYIGRADIYHLLTYCTYCAIRTSDRNIRYDIDRVQQKKPLTDSLL